MTYIDNLHMTVSMMNRAPPMMERFKSSIPGENIPSWSFQANYSSSNIGSGGFPYMPSMRRYDSYNSGNNFNTQITNANIITNIKYDRTPTDLNFSHRNSNHFGMMPHGSSSHHIIPIDENNEKGLSISSHKKDSIYQLSQSQSNNNGSNTKYSMIGLGPKPKKEKRTRKRKPTNGGGRDSSLSMRNMLPLININEDYSCPRQEPLSQVDIDIDNDNQSMRDQINESTLDIEPFGRTTTNKTHDSSNSHRHPSLMKNDSLSFMKRLQTEPPEEDPIMIVGLFSEPLVYIRHKGRDLSEPEEYRPVDFEGEISDIAEVVDNKSQRNISFKIGSLNLDNFRKTVENCPEIIHIMCHGDFDKITKQYYLDFENDQAEVFPFYAENIDQYLEGKGLIDTALVFLNACYSEQVAQNFLNKDIKCVIAIEKHSKIDDRVSKDFAKTFYKYLLSDTPFQKAFDNTVSDLNMTYRRNPESYFSFCSHLHKDECRWNDAEHVDLLHIMLKCDCPNRFRNRHKANCVAVFNFQMEFWTDTVSESLALEEEIVLCCCSPEIPHEEIFKFKIFYQADYIKEMRLVDTINRASYRSKKANYMDFDDMKIEKRFASVASMGFNYYMYQLFNYLAKGPGRIGIVNGEFGSGKTTLVQHFANYCYHRNKFNTIFHQDFARIHAIEELISKIMKWISKRTQYSKPKGAFGRKRKNTRTLFILDNLDALVEKYPDRVKREIDNFTQKEDLYFLITLSKNKSLSFSLGIKEIIIKPLSYYVGAQLFLNKSRPMLPSEYKNFNSLIYYQDFERVQALMVFYPSNIISLATKINTVEFTLEGMRKLIDSINERYQIQEATETGIEKSVQIEDDLEEYKFLIFVGFLEHGLFFLEDLGGYAAENPVYETQSIMKFILDEVTDQNQLTSGILEEYNKVRAFRFTESNHTRENVLSIFQSLRNFIIETRLKNATSFEIRTISIETVTLRDSHNLLLFKTLDIRGFLKSHFNRKVFKSFLSVINFLTFKANCLFSYFQENYLIAEDTYFTAFRELEFVGFFVSERLENVLHRKRLLMNFIKTHLLNMKSILDDNILISRFFNHIKLDENLRENPLWAFEQLIMKFFSIAEMESLNESYFDIEIDFKNLVCIIKMDDSLSDSLTRLYLQLSLFSLNSMLKRAFLEKYSHDYYNRINSRISLIKSIFREPYLKNNESNFRVNKLEFYFLKIRAFKKLIKGKRRQTNYRNQKIDPKSNKLLIKLESAIKNLDPRVHSHFLSKVYLMIAKQKYRSNNLDIDTVVNLEYCFHSLPEKFNLNLSLRVHLLLCFIYHDWNNQVLRDHHLNRATEINEKVQNIIYETRVSRIITALHTNNLLPKAQFAFTVASYFKKTSFDFSQIEIVDLDKFKEPFLTIMEDMSGCQANFMFEPLNVPTFTRMLDVDITYKVFCLYFNSITRSVFYFDGINESLEFEAVSPDQIYEIIKARKASIETLIILNPITDRQILNKICLEIPYTIYIEKYELANLATPEAEKQIANFLILNLMKQLISRLVYENQSSILEAFNNSVEIVYDCLEAFIAHNLTRNEEPQETDPLDVQQDETPEESLANLFKANFKFKLLWNNETPFFEKLLEVIDQTACILNINSSDDFGTKFRMKDMEKYPLTENAPMQRRLYKNCQDFSNSEQLSEWLLKTFQQYNRQRKRGRRENGKDVAVCDFTSLTLQTLILYDISFAIDPFISETLAKQIIRLRVTIIILNTTELSLRSPYIIEERQISLPKQDFMLMIFDYDSEENVKAAEVMLRQLTRVITESVFLSSDEDEKSRDDERQSVLSMKKISLGKRISFENPESD